ncbi:MAG: hypothetical protein JSV46_09395 [Candidatus Aminicenantes bacterium]|nr:MAG: hypothetical protein JSV46_09395 [Candidatus Aminicenantes bacterium]
MGKNQKKHHKILTCLLLAGLFALSPELIHSRYSQPELNNDVDLETILKKCAEYCEKLAYSSLYFVCNEKVKEELYRPPPVYTISRSGGTYYSTDYRQLVRKNVCVYDYQLIRKKFEISEKRILIEENGKKKNEKDARLKTRIFAHSNLIFGPVGLLSEFWQEFYNYTIIKREKFKKNRVIIIEATPIPHMKTSNLYGRIWVREDDFSIVKIEWEPESIQNFELIEELAKKLSAKPELEFLAEYDFEKNGIRFPSKCSITERYLRQKGGSYTRSKTIITYKDYKFFTVETEVKYDKRSVPK